MLHYGDICELNGAEMPPVDVITGGSPCQDLSVAGKREGLAGARSGLFMEQIRIVKEMREATNGKYPRFMVWENVTGCFSSNKGEDFRCVLEETAKIADENAVIPGPPKGKWTHAGCIVGDGWSIAWRVHDAQFWGVPQRRRRICLVADFAGQSAGEILFELRREAGQGNAEQAVGHPGEECGSKVPPVSESVSGHPAEGGEEGQEAPGDAGTGTSETGGVVVLNDQAVAFAQNQRDEVRCLGEAAGALAAEPGVHQQTYVLQGNMIGRKDRNGPQGSGVNEDVPFTLNATDRHAVCIGNGHADIASHITDEVAQTLNYMQDQLAVCVENHPNDSRVKIRKDGTVQTLSGRMGTGGGNVPLVATYQEHTGTLSPGAHAGSYNGQGASNDMLVANSYIVRRLTPREAERLQGFPDGWTDIGDWVDSKGKKHKGESDSPRYKALGNSIALPFWEWMAKRMVKHLPDMPCMGSLFSGIGGFEVVFSRAGCPPAWCSEIEEFCVEVTKRRFGNEQKMQMLR